MVQLFSRNLFLEGSLMHKIFFIQNPKFDLKINKDFRNFYHTSISCDIYQGYGVDLDQKKSQTKALYELFERYVMQVSSNNLVSSNGWSAHSSLQIAKENSQLELIERDVILTSWLKKIPPLNAEKVDLKKYDLSDKYQFWKLTFVNCNNLVVLGGILMNTNNNKKVFTSSAALNYQTVENKIFEDLARCLEMVSIDFTIQDKLINYHYTSFSKLSMDELKFWLSSDPNFHTFKTLIPNIQCILFEEYSLKLKGGSTAYVVRAKSDIFQNLF